MNIAAIRQLVENCNRDDLVAAETALMEEQPLAIDVPGIDEGEQLTHVIAALWIQDQKEAQGTDTMTAIREYTKRVRTSIT